MVTIIDETGTRHEVEGLAAEIAVTAAEFARVLPHVDNLRVVFDVCAGEVVMRPEPKYVRKKRRVN